MSATTTTTRTATRKPFGQRRPNLMAAILMLVALAAALIPTAIALLGPSHGCTAEVDGRTYLVQTHYLCEDFHPTPAQVVHEGTPQR